MSPLSPDDLRIVLCPDQVAVARMRRAVTLRGFERRVDGTQVLAAAPGGEVPWGGALAALEAALPRLGARRAQATVILSNHFVRYALVPWNEGLGDESEELACARHCFGELYGEAAQDWELRVSPGRAGGAQLASAVDAGLLAALRALFERSGAGLASVQPHLMAAFNGCQARLRGRSAWLALLEPGSLCLALLHRGEWARIRTLRIGAAWREELPVILERETYLGGPQAATGEVFLWAPQLDGDMMPEAGRWRIRHLKPVGAATSPRFPASADRGEVAAPTGPTPAAQPNQAPQGGTAAI